jgi:uncharacterized protein (DUF1778 family)
MSSAVPSDARIAIRLPASFKSTIEEAAALRGQSLTDFAVSTLMDGAHRIIEENRVTELSNRDRDRFLAMLDDDQVRPNKALRAAAKAYRKWAKTAGK